MVRDRRGAPRRRPEAPARHAGRGGRRASTGTSPGRWTCRPRTRARSRACGASRAARSRSRWRGSGADGTAGKPYFPRRFVPGETEEVRLYLRGGDDRVIVEGTARRHPGARDRRRRRRRARRLEGRRDALLRLRGPRQGRQGAGHDVGPPLVRAAPGAEDRAVDPAARLGARLVLPALGELQLRLRRLPRRRLRHEELRLPPGAVRQPALAERGLGLRREPAARSTTRASSTARTRGSRPGLTAYYSGLEVLRYYGFGNDTKPESDDDLNKVRQQQVVFLPSLTLPRGRARSTSRSPRRCSTRRRRRATGWSTRRSRTATATSGRWAAGRACASTRAGRSGSAKPPAAAARHGRRLPGERRLRRGDRRGVPEGLGRREDLRLGRGRTPRRT